MTDDGEIAMITVRSIVNNNIDDDNEDDNDEKIAKIFPKDPIPLRPPMLTSISALSTTRISGGETDSGIICHGEKKKLSESKVDIVNSHSSCKSRMYMKIATELKNSTLSALLVIFICGMVVINSIFAGLFLVNDEVDDDDSGTTCCEGDFEEALWLSIETFSSVGYGTRSAEDRWKHIVVIFNIVAGFFWYAVFGGIMYVKVVRGHVDDVVYWSPVLTICDIPHVPCPVLSLRTLNLCGHTRKIYDFTIQMFLVSGETGHHFNMKLSGNDHVPVFTSLATVFHEINETSPLWGITQDSTKPGGKFCDSYVHVVIRGEDSRVSSYATVDQVYMLGSEHKQCFFGRYHVPAFVGMETESLDRGTIGLKFCQVAFQSTFPSPLTYPGSWAGGASKKSGDDDNRGNSGGVSPRRFSVRPRLPTGLLASHPSIRIRESYERRGSGEKKKSARRRRQTG
eukprot:g2593.t1